MRQTGQTRGQRNQTQQNKKCGFAVLQSAIRVSQIFCRLRKTLSSPKSRIVSIVGGMRCRPGRFLRQQNHLPFLLAALWVALCSVTRMPAEDLTTASGHTFHNVQVTSRSATTLVVQSNEGQVVVPVSDLKAADKEKFSKDLTKAIELPALTVIGEQKADFTKAPPDSRIENIADKEFRRQAQEKKDKTEDKARHPQYRPYQITPGIGVGVGGVDIRSDSATNPSYLTPEYQSLSPSIVEKQLKVFADAVEKSQ
jgi:hypothetical protein